MKYYIFINDENKLDGCGTCYTDGAVEISQEKYEAFKSCPDKYDYINGELTDISNTPKYIAEQAAKEKEAQNIEIQKQLDELDKKRIRAICEGGEKEAGKTWLAYYNEQAVILRSQLNEV